MPRLTNAQRTYLETIRGTRWSMQSLAALPLDLVTEAIRDLTPEQRIELWYDWPRHARPEQLAPGEEGSANPRDDWQKWLYLGGRGAGKTRSGAEWTRAQVEAGAKNIALVAETLADARDVMVYGPAGIMAVSPPWNKPVPILSRRRVEWRNGAVANAVQRRRARAFARTSTRRCVV
jgi:hypothetical protein